MELKRQIQPQEVIMTQNAETTGASLDMNLNLYILRMLEETFSLGSVLTSSEGRTLRKMVCGDITRCSP